MDENILPSPSSDHEDDTLGPEDLNKLASSPRSYLTASGPAPSPTGGFESALSDNNDNYAPSPTETSSFHTADSLDSHDGDHSSTEIEEEDVDISLRRETHHNSKSSASGQARGTRPVYHLPPGYENQPKLAVVDDSVPALNEKPPLPEESLAERINRVQCDSNEPYIRRRPSIDIPNESTPLITQNSYRSEDGSIMDKTVCNCCIIQ